MSSSWENPDFRAAGGRLVLSWPDGASPASEALLGLPMDSSRAWQVPADLEMGAAGRIQAASRGYGYSLESMVKLDSHNSHYGT
jgi:hypothetical protein